ncbi:hypothetical protein LINGRAHAP2_LOCUS20584 [Linum grandiflorum]
MCFAGYHEFRSITGVSVAKRELFRTLRLCFVNKVGIFVRDRFCKLRFLKYLNLFVLY